ncbi:DUF6090 family protein [Yeosuana sp. MJ-SS3]|uniref:DUF6090 family protein n=1 Tax=Gilvirhabdus luticola TaxID=3079858 RepID=A0ABU3U5B0_9FLAO|nr:DUF6090 family protein [Yeosuana sp. MJ-SS3]MDU8885604.1 DUF6090 family protein [Yeosuana sp. MJ-SS3]
MIQFFRRIRKTLVDDNKPIKYLRYAIGEIVLVMIGILLALQVNNWNQDRQQRQKEKQILIELKRDLVSNDSILQNTIEIQQIITGEITSLIAHLKNKEPFNDTIGMYLNHAYFVERIQFTSSAYESLKSIGIDIISSNNLRADIANLFSNEFPNKTLWMSEAGLLQTSAIKPYYTKFLEAIDEKNPVKSSLGHPEYQYIVDYVNLLKSREFINELAGRKRFKRAICFTLEQLQDKVKKTVNEIDKELEHFNP